MASYSNVPLAIISMGCRLPGGDGLNDYWQLIKSGRSAVTELPASRLNRELYYSPKKGETAKTYSTIAGLVSTRPTSSEQFHLSEKDLLGVDQAHLALLEVASQAVRHAGYDPNNISSRRAGVYLGHSRGSDKRDELLYASVVREAAPYLSELKEFEALSRGQSDEVIADIVRQVRSEYGNKDDQVIPKLEAYHAAQIISKAFDLDGPYMSLNAACSSSLMALAIGARALELGKIDMALVGGASFCKFNSLLLFSKAQSVSATGSRPFDADADGLVTAEGYAVILVKTLEKAIQDGDNICAVIQGIGISSDGRGKSLWAPRKEGQTEAFHRAYSRDVQADRVQYIEAHATSTQVGDATEVNALAEAIAKYLPKEKKIPIGSVKANIGHCLETAGLAGLVKTVLALQNKWIPPVINLQNLNPKVDWEKSPFFVPTESMPWPDARSGEARRAGVNSFGIGGLNAHVVIDEYLPQSAVSVRGASLPSSESNVSVVKQDAVAIIGMSAILPGALELEAFWELIHRGNESLCEVPNDRWNSEILENTEESQLAGSSKITGGFITDYQYDWRMHKIPPKQVAKADPIQFMLLDAVDQALQESGYKEKEFDRLRTGVVVGTVFNSEFSSQLQMGMRIPEFTQTLKNVLAEKGAMKQQLDDLADSYVELLLERMPALMDESGSFTSSTLASRITKTFDIMGGATALDSGNMSSFNALETCCNSLQTHQCDMMICAAGQRSLGLEHFESLLQSKHDLNSPIETPVEKKLGEGVAVLILKRLDDAKRNGDKIHAIIRGIGIARKNGFASSMASAMRRGLKLSRSSSEAISSIESSVNRTQEIEKDESKVIETVYGRNSADKKQLPLDSVTRQIGSTGGAAGMVSLIKAGLALKHCKMPLGSNQDAISLQPDSEGRVFIGVNAECDADLCGHVILERGESVPFYSKDNKQNSQLKILNSSWRIVRCSAPTVSEMLHKVSLFTSERSEAFQEAPSYGYQTGDLYRMAIVANNPDDLRAKASLAVKHFENHNSQILLENQGIIWSEVTETPRPVAFLFPGQGSQYPGMLKSLVQENQAAKKCLEKIDSQLMQLGYPTFDDLTNPCDNPSGEDIWHTQLSILISDIVMFETVSNLDIKPDYISGHSFGEFPALYAAGAWDFEHAAQATYYQSQAVRNCRGKGVMLSTLAEESKILQICEPIKDSVFVAVYNTPRQSVIAGSKESIDRIAQKLKNNGISTKYLSTSHAFPTPLMNRAKGQLRNSLKKITIEPPTTRFLSSANNRYIAEPEEIRSNLASQMTEPVRYVDLVMRLADEGIRTFVEIGPDQFLTRLHREILGDRRINCISTDDRKLSYHEKWMRVQAHFEVLGLLSKDALQQPIVNVRSKSFIEEVTKVKPEKSGPSSKFTHQYTNLHKAKSVNLVELTGSAYEIGFRHGRNEASNLRQILYSLCKSKCEINNLLPINIIKKAEHLIGKESMEEIRGIADGADVAWENILALNLRIQPGSVDDGCHFTIAKIIEDDSDLLHAIRLLLPRFATVNINPVWNLQARYPEQGQSYLTFGAPGQVGTSVGINSQGLAVSSILLKNADVKEFSIQGMLHTSRIKKLLQNSNSLETALKLLKESPVAGEWGICLSDLNKNRVAYVECVDDKLEIDFNQECTAGSNHRRLHSSIEPLTDRFCSRLTKLKHLIAESEYSRIDSDCAMEILQKQNEKVGNNLIEHGNYIDIVMNQSAETISLKLGSTSDMELGQPITIDVHHLLKTGYLIENNKQSKPISAQKQTRQPMIPSVVSAQNYFSSSADFEEKQSFASDSNICHRFVMRMVESPTKVDPQTKRCLTGSVFIIGNNSFGRELAKEITNAGNHAFVLPETEDSQQAIRFLQECWEQSPLMHLMIVTPFDPSAETSFDPHACQRRCAVGVILPYLITQHWYKLVSSAGLLNSATISACTRLGGDFGFSNNATAVESGALSGLLKGLSLEVNRLSEGNTLRTKLIDSTSDISTAKLARFVLNEISSGDDEIEVGFSGERRFVVRPIFNDFSKGIRSSETTLNDGVWLVTGGARGVTAACVRELGLRFGMKLHLIGSSPLPRIDPKWRSMSTAELRQLKTDVIRMAAGTGGPPIEAWKKIEKAMEIDENLQGFIKAGIQVEYHSCNLADRSSLKEVLERIRKKDGPIDGILHGAGFESACRFEKKNPELVEKTIAVKVDGATALMELTKNDPLKYFIAFGSISGRFGGVGQTDYCLASEMLAKQINWFRNRRPECRSVCFHWHAWGEVGMAARPESRAALELAKLKFLPPDEGVKHLINEIEFGAPEGEVVITQWDYYQRRYKDNACLLPQTEKNEIPTIKQSDRNSFKPGASNTPIILDEGKVAKRHVLRMVDSPTSAKNKILKPAGPALILGDNSDACELKRQLEAIGTKVRHLKLRENLDTVIAMTKQIFSEEKVPHLFLMTARDSNANRLSNQNEWKIRRRKGIQMPFWVCQQWVKHVIDSQMLDRVTLAAAVSLGGNFGLESADISPEGGAIAGLCKAIYVETKHKYGIELKSLIVDFPRRESSSDVAKKLLEEIAASDKEKEVAYIDGSRKVVRAFYEAIHNVNAPDISPNSVWIATGGARGITAKVAKELGHRFGVKLHLIGRQPLVELEESYRNLTEGQLKQLKKTITQQALKKSMSPGVLWSKIEKEIELDKNLSQMRESGIQLTYHSCDVNDWETMRQTLEKIRLADGPIEGIIHGAGVRTEAGFLHKTKQQLDNQVDTKIGGALALMSLTRQDPIRYFLGFGSISGRFGANGRTDYALVNEMLCKLINWYQSSHPNCRAIGFHWHSWGDVGMMTRSSAFGARGLMDLSLMPAEEGIEHLFNELGSKKREREILITDWDFYKRYYPEEIIQRDA